ncbi:MAG TPA: gas vesicle protein GvpG [Humisphaera sp.]|jgi:hypothetical protein|nr:gas vesicle protein GvpG [Humisphaera sp.]
MGLLKLLTFPVSMPIAGARWTLSTLLSEAERRYYDPAAIRQEMTDLEQQFAAGLIDQQTFDDAEEALLERLLDAREYQAQKTAEQEEEW